MEYTKKATEPSEQSKLIAKNLRKLRTQNKLTVEGLHNALIEKYGWDISTASLKNYEVTGSHTRADANLGMSIKQLVYLADFYDVSADYILGRSNDPARKPSAVDELGLTPEAAKKIKNIGITNPKSLETLNRFLEDSLLAKTLIQITQIANAVAAEKAHLEKLQETGKKVPFHHLGAVGAEMYENQTSTALLLELARNHSEIPDIKERIMVIFGMDAIEKRIDSIGENFSDIIQSIVKFDELADLHSEVWGYGENI